MDVIQSYLDNVFATFPQTDEIQRLKRDMLGNMEERYTTLRQGGKNEHEAAYSVIANFGNIEEITAELGLDLKKEYDDEDIFLSRYEAETYLSKSKKSSVWIGLGVWLIIAGVSSVLILEHVFVLFLSIAIAVIVFIMNDNQMNAYESFEKTCFRLDAYTREKFDIERTQFMTRCNIMIAIGVALIILSVGAFTVLDFDLATPAFLNVVGFSVFLFILADSYRTPYDILLGKGEHVHTKKKAYKQAARIVGTIAAVYWPTVTAIFLLWSFSRNAWGISWMIWPIAGLLFGAISGGISVWFGTKER